MHPMLITDRDSQHALHRRQSRIGRIIQKSLDTDKDIIFGDHHLSHAASAFLVSPFDEAAILTADGVGEWCTTAWFVLLSVAMLGRIAAGGFFP